MRTALCLFGVVGNTKTKSCAAKSHGEILDVSGPSYQKNIIEPNKVDVFIHTWDTHLEKKIRSIFKPVKSIFEEQIVFDIPDHVQAKGGRPTPEHRKQVHWSMFYSIKSSVGLKAQYEKENDFTYDCVMIGRFDTSWETVVDFSKFDMSKFYVDRCCQMWYNGTDIFNGGKGPIYKIRDQIDWTQVVHTHKKDGTDRGQGLMGLWFFSNSKNIDDFSLIYDHLFDYTTPGVVPRSEKCLSSHTMVEYHVESLGIYDDLEWVFHFYDDHPQVRRKYFGAIE